MENCRKEQRREIVPRSKHAGGDDATTEHGGRVSAGSFVHGSYLSSTYCMSKWLGRRSPPPLVSASCKLKGGVSPKSGRRTTEETALGGTASRRSSQQSEAVEHAGEDAAGAVSDPGKGKANADHDSEWEMLEHASALEGLGGTEGEHDDVAAAARPLSPGVDFSTAYMVHKEGRAGQLEADKEASAGEEYDDCKWQDAAIIHSFLVRGPTYLQNKAKLPAGAAMCRLLGFDCFTESSKGTTRIDHIASRGACRERVEAMTSGDDAPFLFIMNIQVRGTPPVSMVAYWAVDRQGLQAATRKTAQTTTAAGGGPQPRAEANGGTNAAGGGHVANGAGRGGGDTKGQLSADAAAGVENGVGKIGRGVSEHERVFLEIVASYADFPVSSFGGDSCAMMDETTPPPYSDERNARFKLIPRVIGGPWMVRKAVGSTPVLLGTKITHRYYRGERYVETDMDTGSSPAAASLCGRCRGLSRKIDVELGIVLQANSAGELPEALLGAVRLNGFGVEDPALQTKLFA